MVAFRKLFPALAVGAFLIGTAQTASAQANPLVCDTNAGVPPVVRAEGHTELTGDILIVCRGGNPNVAMNANFQLFLNTQVTSRLIAGGSGVGTLSEALLMIDEPGSASNGNICVSPGPLSNSGGLEIIGNVAGGTATGNRNSETAPACNPLNGGSNQTGTYNVFRGQPANAANVQQVPANSQAAVVWTGIPIVPPGTNLTRTFRITNVRANAAGIPASASLVPSQIFAFISISASQSLAVNNPQQAVAFVLPGLQFDTRNCGNTGGAGGAFLQCVSQNGALFTNPSAEGPGVNNIFALRYREGFQTAFKVQIAGPNATDPQANQNQLLSVPGVVYNTESGFVRTDQTLLSGVGVATQATRVAARFRNLPEGVRLFVSTQSVRGTNQGSTTADAILVSTDANGAGGTTSVGSGGITSVIGVPSTTTLTCGSISGAPAAELTITGTGTGRSAMAVWEVTSSNASVLDTLFFAVGVAYNANTSNDLPTIGTSEVNGSFAPFYAANSTVAPFASATLPIPRFIDNTEYRPAFQIVRCVSNLLFPFVTNQAGFDTGIAISNTSRDPFGGAAGRVQNGRCTINYYGNVGGTNPAPPADTTTNPVNAGEQLLFVLSSGGTNGIDAVPNFQGYIIAQCEFQYAHGFAFITDGPVGQARVAEGYLALVMDESIGTRTGSRSETLGH